MNNFILTRPDWHQHAACRGMMLDPEQPNFFIPRGDQIGMLKRVRQVCDECPVKDDCLDYALNLNIQVGIWGGKSANERRRIRRERGITGTDDDWGYLLSVEAQKARNDRERLEGS